MIYPFVEREFEGKMYPFFHDVEGFLIRNYGEKGLRRFENGEWIDPYPIEKRKIRHIKKISVYENPSPGNKAGGITTLEEKSLGCIQKGGTAPVTAVLDYGDTAREKGLNLLNGHGNDMVAITNLTAAGCHLILFTTGRGTPLGGAVPTVKIASNDNIANKKPHWIDFSAYGFDKDNKADELLSLIKEVADGKPTKNELCGNREIAIFKDGVTL